MSAETLDLVTQSFQIFTMRVERFSFGGAEVQRERQQQPLARCCTALQRVHELLVQNALVRRVLIDENQPVFVVKRDVGATQLKERRNDLRLVRRFGRDNGGRLLAAILRWAVVRSEKRRVVAVVGTE